VVATAAVGAGTAVAMGASAGGGALFGLAVALSSSVVIVNITRSRRRTAGSATADVLLGWTVVQDITGTGAALVLIALLQIEGRSVGATLGRIVLFVVLAAVCAWLLPLLLRRLREDLDLFLLVSVSSALVIAGAGAHVFGVPLALGAFVGGLTVGESPEAAAARERLLPFRDLFAVLFFVLVGTLFDPKALAGAWAWAVLVVALVAGAKALPTLALVPFLRMNGVHAPQVAVGIAQVGEFSFVLASLRAAHGLLPPRRLHGSGRRRGDHHPDLERPGASRPVSPPGSGDRTLSLLSLLGPVALAQDLFDDLQGLRGRWVRLGLELAFDQPLRHHQGHPVIPPGLHGDNRLRHVGSCLGERDGLVANLRCAHVRAPPVLPAAGRGRVCCQDWWKCGEGGPRGRTGLSAARDPSLVASSRRVCQAPLPSDALGGADPVADGHPWPRALVGGFDTRTRSGPSRLPHVGTAPRDARRAGWSEDACCGDTSRHASAARSSRGPSADLSRVSARSIESELTSRRRTGLTVVKESLSDSASQWLHVRWTKLRPWCRPWP
jgi:Kef-type K+ transport system membrane component KefB